MSRRQTVMSILTAGGIAMGNAAFGRLAPSDHEPPVSGPNPPPGDAVEGALRADLARLGSRAYSDEGIPVFLACENLKGRKVGAPGAAVTSFNRAVASDLHKNAEAWLRIFPNAPDTDIARLIEVLAERDFNRARRGDTA